MTGRKDTAWDPGQYHRFGGHRLRPALELFQRVNHASPGLVYDLGCGGGEIARIMAERWPDATVIGADYSADMLAKAAVAPSTVRWEQVDVRDWQPEAPIDVLYSNAMFQWVDGHNALFPNLIGHMAPGGVFAVQMPLSWSQPSHRLMREVLATGGPGGTALGGEDLARGVARKWVADATEYYDLLVPLVSHIDIWETRYIQILEGDDPVLEWVKGTGLRPILSGLEGADKERFLSVYREALREPYPRRAGGETLYPFGRLFIVATI